MLSCTATKPQSYTPRPGENRGSYHTTAQTGTQYSILDVGACLQYTNQCTQTNMPLHTHDYKQTQTHKQNGHKRTYTNTLNEWINKKAQPLYTVTSTWERRASSSKWGLKEHAATPPGRSLLLPPTPPNSQYMFKGHPLTFHSHRPLCDLLLSAKGFEEHSNSQHQGESKGGSKRDMTEGRKRRRETNNNDKRCALLTDGRQRVRKGGKCGLQEAAGLISMMEAR